MTKTKAPGAREDFDRAQLARCKRFTVCVFLGRAKYETTEFGTLAEARAHAATLSPPRGRVPLLYGITPDGLTVCVNGVKGI